MKRGCVAERLDVVQICVTVMLVLRSRFRCCFTVATVPV